MKITDVLVIGAGPTGLTLGTALLTRGIDATVVDKLPLGANTSRAAVVNARSLEVLENLDVSWRLVKAGLAAPRFTMREGSRVLIPVDFSGLPTRYPFSLMLSQADTERLLEERFNELGGEVLRPKTLCQVEQDTDGVMATFDDGEIIRATYLVGADGMHSTVRQHAGIGFTGGEFAESFVLADVRVTGEAPCDEVILFYGNDGLTVLAPLPDNIFRIVAPTADAPRVPSTEFAQRLLDTRGFGPGRTTVTELLWGSRFRIQHRVADSYRSGRLLLAGDAAHVHSPAGGQGMNLGITDAVALSDAVAEVLRGGPESALDAYSDIQRGRAQKVLTLTGRLTKVSTMPPPLRPIRNAVMRVAAHLPAVQRQLAWRLSGLIHR